MNWFRKHFKHGSRLALFALAIQLALSWGHFHTAAAPAGQIGLTGASLAIATPVAAQGAHPEAAQLCSHESEFGKMTPYCIDRLGPLTNHKIANAEHHCHGLLLFALCRYEPHSRPLGCFTDRFGVSGIVLLPLQ